MGLATPQQISAARIAFRDLKLRQAGRVINDLQRSKADSDERLFEQTDIGCCNLFSATRDFGTAPHGSTSTKADTGATPGTGAPATGRTLAGPRQLTGRQAP